MMLDPPVLWRTVLATDMPPRRKKRVDPRWLPGAPQSSAAYVYAFVYKLGDMYVVAHRDIIGEVCGVRAYVCYHTFPTYKAAVMFAMLSKEK